MGSALIVKGLNIVDNPGSSNVTRWTWIEGGRPDRDLSPAELNQYIVKVEVSGNGIDFRAEITINRPPNIIEKVVLRYGTVSTVSGILVDYDVFTITYTYSLQIGTNPPIKKDPQTVTTEIQSDTAGGRTDVFTEINIKLTNDSKLSVSIFFQGANYNIIRVRSDVDLRPLKDGQIPTVPKLLMPNITNTPSLYIIWNTDQLGSNLGEIICLVGGNYLPNDQYDKRLIGKYSWFDICPKETNYFSKYPNLLKVMKGHDTLNGTYYQKAQQLNDTKLSTTDFYLELLSFMSVRYFLGGLSSDKLSSKWLLQRNTEKFYKLLSQSDFSIYLELFSTVYKGYDKYMRY